MKKPKRILNDDIRNFRKNNKLTHNQQVWFFGVSPNDMAHKKDCEKLPVSSKPISLGTRHVNLNPEDLVLPVEPTYQDLLDALSQTDFKATQTNIALICGVNFQAANAWAKKRTKPATGVVRVWEIIINTTRKDGQVGLDRWLRTVDLEARARGLTGGLDELFRLKAWPSERQDKTE